MNTPTDAALASQGLTANKPYGVTVVVCNHTDGNVDQVISITEFAGSGPEQVYKYQWICDAIIEALNGANEEGSGGVFREMGEDFQEAMDEVVAAGGDPTVDNDPSGVMMRDWLKQRGRGQGKPKKTGKNRPEVQAPEQR